MKREIQDAIDKLKAVAKAHNIEYDEIYQDAIAKLEYVVERLD